MIRGIKVPQSDDSSQQPLTITVSEEAANAAKAVPMGIIASIAMCCRFRFSAPDLTSITLPPY